MKVNLIGIFHGWSCTQYHLFCLCQSEISFSEKKKAWSNLKCTRMIRKFITRRSIKRRWASSFSTDQVNWVSYRFQILLQILLKFVILKSFVHWKSIFTVCLINIENKKLNRNGWQHEALQQTSNSKTQIWQTRSWLGTWWHAIYHIYKA